MANEQKTLVKGFKTLIQDLMDNYDIYTDEEKAKIKELFQQASELNALLDKYDTDKKMGWQEYFVAVDQYFNAFRF